MPSKLKKAAKQVAKKAVKATIKRAPQLAQQLLPEHYEMLTALTDPFSSEAANARYPDQGAGKSLTSQVRINIPVATDATGVFAYAFNPKPNFFALPSASSSSKTITWGSVWTQNLGGALINTYGKSYRPTSYGIRIVNTLSATDSKGYIIIAKGGPPAVSGTTTFDMSNFGTYDMHANAHGGEYHVTGHPRSSNAYDFKDVPSFGTTTAVDDTWETIYIAGFGLPNSSNGAIILEAYFNHEYSALEDATIAQLAVPQPIFDTGMMTAVNHVQSSHPPSHKGGRAVVSNFIKKEGKKALIKHVLPFAKHKAAALLL